MLHVLLGMPSIQLEAHEGLHSVVCCVAWKNTAQVYCLTTLCIWPLMGVTPFSVDFMCVLSRPLAFGSCFCHRKLYNTLPVASTCERVMQNGPLQIPCDGNTAALTGTLISCDVGTREFDQLKEIRTKFDEAVQHVAEARQALLQGFTIWSDAQPNAVAWRQDDHDSGRDETVSSIHMLNADPDSLAYQAAKRHIKGKAIARRRPGRGHFIHV